MDQQYVDFTSYFIYKFFLSQWLQKQKLYLWQKKKTAVVDKDGAEKSDGATSQLEAYRGQWNLTMHYLPWELIS